MPRISEFFGIAIYMYWRDHDPPHFHAVYAEHQALISIADLTVLRGTLPPRAMGLVIEWATLHRRELEVAWQRVRNLEPPGSIDPLE